MKPALIISAYLIAINIIASLMTASDKRKAQKNKWRIPESTLMAIGFFGGALGEYITMRKIHHKTKHALFMVGLPLIIFLHIIITILIIYKVAF